jgi:hypothetical protein
MFDGRVIASTDYETTPICNLYANTNVPNGLKIHVELADT